MNASTVDLKSSPSEEVLVERGVISRHELASLIEQQQISYILIDVRNPDEHERGLIPTAQRLPLPELESALRNLSDKEWRARYSFAKPRKNDLLILYCRSGVRSQSALETFRFFGYSRVCNYVGSFLDWFPDRVY